HHESKGAVLRARAIGNSGADRRRAVVLHDGEDAAVRVADRQAAEGRCRVLARKAVVDAVEPNRRPTRGRARGSELWVALRDEVVAPAGLVEPSGDGGAAEQ